MERALKLAIISDVHLGTFGCHAKELLIYLKSIKPEILILNGDFIDGWQFRRSYFPTEHIQVIYEIMRKAMDGTRVYYLAGNHDEFIRKFVPFFSGNIYFRDQLELEFNGNRYLFFHGDVFDFSIQLSPFIAKLGGIGYDHLIRLNTYINKIRSRFGFQRISFAHLVKYKLKKAIRYIQSFEEEAIQFARQRKVDFVVCGHIHIPCIREIVSEQATITYMNSGDWIENLTVLEYCNSKWSIVRYDEMEFHSNKVQKVKKEALSEVYSEIMKSPMPDFGI
ncbi:MAG: UDP-2,3-diacylglucosamine diphosphatase [Saprospiraceae bacterium]|nr:UDP-2,3-diacylglucosamine diphosphatase [Saprospiraceae bacterium]